MTPTESLPTAAVKTVLVVDDDTSMRAIVCSMLRENGYAVRDSHDGGDALDLVRSGAVAPDLILLDWSMPVPGETFAREYRQLPEPHAPIVVVTAASAETAVHAAQTSGARGFLRKPFEIDELSDLVRRLVGPARQAPATSKEASSARPGRLGSRLAVRHARATQTERERRRQLERLSEEARAIQGAAEATRVELSQLLEAETERRLTADETVRVRTLRWETERLRMELGRLREHFEGVRGGLSGLS